MNNTNAIVRRAFVEGFVDDHGLAGRIIPSAVAIFVRGVDAETSVCPLEENSNQCINPLYEGEDGIHLSSASCGGVIRARGTSLEKAINQYNNEHSFAASVANGAQFGQVILIRKEDFLRKSEI